MSTAAPPPEMVARLKLLTVRNLTVTVAAKRTVKVGDEFRSFESSMSVTLHDSEGAPLTVEEAQLAAILQTPNLLTKIYTDLWIGGVMSKAETIDRMKEAKLLYPRLAGVQDDEGTDHGDLRGTGYDAGPAGPVLSPGADVPAGEVAGVPEVSGPFTESDR